ncbi:MAG: radical SAM family heme chaperone HemW [Chloroflexota bacterium]
MALYLHIPFCQTKCSYCDFNTYANLESLIPAYVEALLAEARRYPAGLPVQTINFGGGTPSLLSPAQLGQIILACRERFSVENGAEVSMEANPGGLTAAYYADILAAGVNRISFGFQSFHEPELALLTRRHSAGDATRALREARDAGFGNINLDFMYGLPGQPLDRWRETLEHAIALRPEHLSLYGLTLHEGLPLTRKVAAGCLPGQDEDLMADMYELAETLLSGVGYDHYEISNWAREPRFRCRHNLAYWQSTDYVGLGAGAHSFFRQVRYVNELRPRAYIRKALAGADLEIEREAISPPLAAAERTILALRLSEGAALDRGQLMAVTACLEAALLEVEGTQARLTARGRLLSNEVFWRLLPDKTCYSPSPEEAVSHIPDRGSQNRR